MRAKTDLLINIFLCNSMLPTIIVRFIGRKAELREVQAEDGACTDLFRAANDKFSYKCLRCGNVRESANEDRLDDYPEDDSVPCSVW